MREPWSTSAGISVSHPYLAPSRSPRRHTIISGISMSRVNSGLLPVGAKVCFLLCLTLFAPKTLAAPAKGAEFRVCSAWGQFNMRSVPPLNRFFSFASKIFKDGRSDSAMESLWTEWLSHHAPLGDYNSNDLAHRRVECESFATLNEARERWQDLGYEGPDVKWPQDGQVKEIIPAKMPTHKYWQCVIGIMYSQGGPKGYWTPIVDIPRGHTEFEIREHVYIFMTHQHHAPEVVGDPLCSSKFDFASLEREKPPGVGSSLGQQVDYDFSEWKIKSSINK